MRSFLRYLAILPALLLAASAYGQPRLVLGSVVDQSANYSGRLLQMIYTEAFRQLHIEFEIKTYPALRSTIESTAGNIDGEIIRSAEYGAAHPELVRVDEPVVRATMAVFSHDPAIRVGGWSALRGKAYRVEFRSGYEVLRQRLAALVPPQYLSSVADGRLGLKKLAAGRTDLYIDAEEYVTPMLATAEFQGIGIHHAGTLETVPLYCYLHRRHAALAPRLAGVLRGMRASGVIERYKEAARKAPPG